MQNPPGFQGHRRREASSAYDILLGIFCCVGFISPDHEAHASQAQLPLLTLVTGSTNSDLARSPAARNALLWRRSLRVEVGEPRDRDSAGRQPAYCSIPYCDENPTRSRSNRVPRLRVRVAYVGAAVPGARDLDRVRVGAGDPAYICTST